MKIFAMMIGAWLAGLSPALAQAITVEVTPEQEYFLPHEKLQVKVRITNFSGRTLELGKDNDWLSFAIECRNHLVVSQTAPVPVKGEFTLETGKVATRTVDLAPCFELGRPEHYTLRATVRFPQLQAMMTSPPATFDVMSGATLWEQDFGLPRTASGGNAAPEIRKYALLQTIHSKPLQLYVRVSDGTGARVFRVFPVGPMISFSHPEPQVDRFGNLHLLWQTGARSFSYSVVNPDGLLIARESYDLLPNSRPALQAIADGRIGVKGGVRRISKDDVPPPASSLSSNNVEPPK